MCGDGIQVQPKLDVEDGDRQVLLYEQHAEKLHHEEDLYLRHKNKMEVEINEIMKEGYQTTLTEYAQRSGERWDEARRWLKIFNLVPEDLSPMEFCRLMGQTPHGRILYFEECIFSTATLRLVTRKELEQLTGRYGLSISKLWKLDRYHLLRSLSTEITGTGASSGSIGSLKKSIRLEKGLRILVLLRIPNCIRQQKYLEARQNGLVLDPQDLSKVQWRELRESCVIGAEDPNFLDHIRRNMVACLPLTWEYASFIKISRLDRWRGIGLVLIHLWDNSMARHLHRIGGICVHLIETPDVQIVEHGLSAQETEELRRNGHLKFRYRVIPRWLSNDFVASWAGVGMVRIFKDEPAQNVIIEVLWEGMDEKWYGFATEKDSIRVTNERMAQLMSRRKIEIPMKGRNPLRTYPYRIYQKRVGIIEFTWLNNKNAVTIELIEAQDPFKTRRDRGRGLSNARCRDTDSPQRQRLDLEAEEVIRPNFGWYLCPTTEGIQPKWRITLSEDRSRKTWAPNLNTPGFEIRFCYDEIVSRETVNTLQRNFWWAMGTSGWLISLVETRDHRLKVRIWGAGPCGFLIMPEDPALGDEEEKLNDEGRLDRENAPHEAPAMQRRLQKSIVEAPTWERERQLYGSMDKFWISLPLVNGERRLLKLLRNDYFSLRRDGKLILLTDSELTAKLIPTTFNWARMGDVLIKSNGPISLLFELRLSGQENQYDEAPFKDVEFRFEGMPWYA